MIVILAIVKYPVALSWCNYLTPRAHVQVVEFEMIPDMVDSVASCGEEFDAESTVAGKLTVFNLEIAVFVEIL